MSVHRSRDIQRNPFKAGSTPFGQSAGKMSRLRSFSSFLAVLFLGVFVVSPQVSSGSLENTAGDPKAMLEAAFVNRYDVNSTAEIELVIRNRRGQERRRNFEAASKIIDDRMHSIGRLTYPGHLRGMTILQIEAKDRSHDAFVYLPSSRSVRRISTNQRGDAFFGTDVTYEDLERRYAKDYEILDVTADTIEGEPVWAVRARPLLRQTYHEVVFWVAQVDPAILQVHFFKKDADEPFRTLVSPRTDMYEEQGHILPTRMVVENVSRGTTTEVIFERLAINPDIDDRIFSARTLQQKRDIPTRH